MQIPRGYCVRQVYLTSVWLCNGWDQSYNLAESPFKKSVSGWWKGLQVCLWVSDKHILSQTHEFLLSSRPNCYLALIPKRSHQKITEEDTMIPGLLLKVSVETAAGLQLAELSPERPLKQNLNVWSLNISHESAGLIPTISLLHFPQVQTRCKHIISTKKLHRNLFWHI